MKEEKTILEIVLLVAMSLMCVLTFQSTEYVLFDNQLFNFRLVFVFLIFVATLTTLRVAQINQDDK